MTVEVVGRARLVAGLLVLVRLLAAAPLIRAAAQALVVVVLTAVNHHPEMSRYFALFKEFPDFPRSADRRAFLSPSVSSIL